MEISFELRKWFVSCGTSPILLAATLFNIYFTLQYNFCIHFFEIICIANGRTNHNTDPMRKAALLYLHLHVDDVFTSDGSCDRRPRHIK